MKKIFYLTCVVLLTGCGGNSTESTDEGTDSTQTAETGTPIDNSIIDPLTDDLGGVIHADDLINSMTVYYDKEILLIVYPNVYADGTRFSQDQACTASPTDSYTSENHVVVNFVQVPDKEITKGQAYLIKGKIKSIGYWKELQVTDAELLELPTDFKTESFNPKAISGSAYYNPLDIVNSISAWDKKMITVTGDYWGTTISKSYDQTKLLEARADIGTTDNKVGCAFETEEEATAFEPGQKGVKIKGELSMNLQFGTSPLLSNCVVVQ